MSFPPNLQEGIKKRDKLINYGVPGPLGLGYDKPPKKYPPTNYVENLEGDFDMARSVSPETNLGDEFEQESQLGYPSTPPNFDWRGSPKASDAELSKFKQQLEPKVGTIESIKRVLGKPEVIVACLAIGTCVLYKIVNGNLITFLSGGKRKTRRKKRNKKRTLRQKYK